MIINLLKLEWSKFRKNSIITLLLVFFLLFFPSALYFGRLLNKISEFFPINVNILEAPLIWDYLGYAGNWIVFFFLGALVIYTVTIDVTNKTMRQNIITGMSRKDFYLSKLFTVMILATLATVYYFILGTVIGWINTEDVSLSKIMDNDLAPLRFWLMCFGYMNVALMIAFLIRKPGISVFAYLTYGLIGEPIIKNWVQKNASDTPLVNYLPMNAMEDLMPLPLFKMAENMTSKVDDYLISFTQASIATIIYSLIFIFIAYTVFKNKDI